MCLYVLAAHRSSNPSKLNQYLGTALTTTDHILTVLPSVQLAFCSRDAFWTQFSPSSSLAQIYQAADFIDGGFGHISGLSEDSTQSEFISHGSSQVPKDMAWMPCTRFFCLLAQTVCWGEFRRDWEIATASQKS